MSFQNNTQNTRGAARQSIIHCRHEYTSCVHCAQIGQFTNKLYRFKRTKLKMHIGNLVIKPLSYFIYIEDMKCDTNFNNLIHFAS